MTTQEKIAVMQAYADGEKIQYRCNGDWVDINSPSWNWIKYIYRVKPEPKLRPYKDSNEFFKAQREHGLYLQEKGKTVGYFPFRVTDICVTWHIGTSSTNTAGYESLLKDYQWQDGSPCGILE